MNDVIRITIPGRPITKKITARCRQRRIQDRCNVRCVYYMPTRGIVDLVGLPQATDDILLHYGVIDDDNSRIVAGHDGSRVCYDRENPRVEITIARLEEQNDGG